MQHLIVALVDTHGPDAKTGVVDERMPEFVHSLLVQDRKPTHVVSFCVVYFKK